MKKKFTKETVDRLADLLMIGLTPEENKMVLDEFNSIDENINKITKIKGIESVKPMTHALDDFECTLREDEGKNLYTTKELLSNASKVDMDEVSVPKIVGGEES